MTKNTIVMTAPIKRPKKTKYNAKQLSDGARIELEHTTSMQLARTIAKNHLDEDPNYYVKLKKVEKGKKH
jgi:hypothetical protein